MYGDGRRESDVEHSYMLALTAQYLANEDYPELDQGLITQFSWLHDLPEVITGDVPTLGISAEARAEKERQEAVATYSSRSYLQV